MRNPRPSNVMFSIIVTIVALFAFFVVGALPNHAAKNLTNDREVSSEQTIIQD